MVSHNINILTSQSTDSIHNEGFPVTMGKLAYLSHWIDYARAGFMVD